MKKSSWRKLIAGIMSFMLVFCQTAEPVIAYGGGANNNLLAEPGGNAVKQIAAGVSHTVGLKADGTVWTWGLNDKGQLGNSTSANSSVPVQATGLIGVTAVAAGSNHSAALKSDGTVWTWGYNNNGQLGNGNNTDSSSPVQVQSLTGVAAIAGGESHTIALKTDGTVRTWGNNANGQLGNNDTSNTNTPVQVSSLSGVAAIAAGDDFSAALKSDGTVWTWGNNANGRLGDGSTTQKITPVQVSGLTGVVAIAAGQAHAAALKSDGTVWTWGNNASGQLGNNSTAESSTPVQVKNTDGTNFSGAAGISAGANHTTALKTDGTVWSWGSNGNGQLGNDSATDSSTAVQVSSLTGITAVTGGANHSTALKSDGTVWAWGNNANGQIGDGSTTQRTTPVQVSGLNLLILTNQIAAGQYHTVGLKVDGTVWAWGGNANGQLGNGTTADRGVPVQVSGLTGAASVAAGANHTVALKTDGTVWTWGYNGNGQLGNGTTTNSSVPVQVSGLTGVVAAAGGGYHTAALKSDGTVWTWGYNGNGQLGNGTETSSSTPIQVSGLTDVISISAGLYHTIALKSDGTVWAWGYNGSGQLGNNSTTDSSTPVQVKNADTSNLTGVTAAAAGASHCAALKTDGTVWSWGNNDSGQLGDNSTTQRNAAVQVKNADTSNLTGVTSVKGGYSHTAALKSDGTVWTWGYNENGQLGNSSTLSSSVPVQTSSLNGVRAVTAGFYHTIALKTDGTVWDWGNNGSYQLGDGTTNQRNIPVQVTGLNLYQILMPGADMLKRIAGGGYHTVGLKTDGTVWTWGRNNFGQLGNDLTADKYKLEQVKSPDGTLTLTEITSAAAGEYHSMALKSDGTVWTWGNNDRGQLGNNNAPTQSKLPVQASGLTDIIGIAAGQYHSMAVKSDGTVWTWGNNDDSQLGDGSQTQSNIPIQVPGLTGVAAIAAGHSFSVALKTDGTVWTWGDNQEGQLGDGSVSDRSTPVQVSGLSGVAAITAGNSHTVALKTDGTVRAWGNNDKGQLGDNSTFDRKIPVTVSGLSGVTAVTAGEYHTIALKADGTVRAWGSNSYGQLGDNNGGTGNYSILPVEVGGLTGVNAVAGGANHTIVLKNDGTVWACGWNGFGQLGDETTTQRNTPVQVYNCSLTERLLPGDNITKISGSMGYYHSAVVKADGTVWTWGYNGYGELGDNTTATKYVPTQVKKSDGSYFTGAVAVAAGEYHTVALKSDGTVWTWGYNANGRLGDGTTTDRYTPVQVTGLTGVFTAVSVGYGCTMALRSDGTVWAWGLNYAGQLGDGTTTQRLTPIQVSGLTGVTAIASGMGHNMALRSDYTVWTWGYDNFGQLGNDSTKSSKSTPVKVSGLNGVKMIAGGGYFSSYGYGHSVAVKADGTVWSWGYNGNNELGDGSTTDQPTPVQVKGADGVGYLTGITSVKGGALHTVALKEDGTVWAWGYNYYGELGDNTGTQRSTPVQASNLTGAIAVGAGYEYTIALKSDGTVWGWGYNPYGNLGTNNTSYYRTPTAVYGSFNIFNVLTPGSNMTKKIAGGDYHTIALKADGTVWTWGRNHKGQLGDGTTTDRNAPVRVSSLSEVTAVACGANHSAALKSDGTVWTWGYNADGQLGDASTSDRTVPVQVSGLTGVSGIAAGANHTVALKSDGTVWTWGYNEYGQLGDGTLIDKNTPVQVKAGTGYLTDVSAVASGANHAAALKSDGTVWTWGYNASGQLGNNSTTNDSKASQVTALTGMVSAVAAGANHTVALKSDGNVWAWGNNENGRLGDGSSTNRLVPVQVTGITGVSAVTAGNAYTAALKQDCTVWTWGLNDNGQLGNNSTTPSLTPVQVKKDENNMLTAVSGIAAGASHAVIFKSDGTVWTWGYNQYGQLGDSSAVDAHMPVQAGTLNLLQQLSTGENMITRIAAGTGHTVALKADGTVWTWGYNASGQLGNNSTTQSKAPVQVTGLTNITAVAAGANHSVALKSDGTVWTWGYNTNGELGNGSPGTNSSIPVQVKGVAGTGYLTDVSAIASGANHCIALKSDGTVYTWGLNTNGRLGNNSTTASSVPVQVGSGLTGVAAVAAGEAHTIALKKDGTVYTWGLNTNGRLGINSEAQSLIPVQVKDTAGTGFLTGIKAVAGGGGHTVALKSDGTVYTWGLNDNGQLGNNSTTQSLLPVLAAGVSGVLSVSAGQAHTAVLKTNGTVWTWGYNEYGQLGDGTATQRNTAVQASGLNGAASIASGANHTVALKADGTVWTWGYNVNGQLGDSTTTNRYIPTQVPNLNLTKILTEAADAITQIAGGAGHTAVLKADGTVWAWGDNTNGQLGNNSTEQSKIPVQTDSLTQVSAVTAGNAHTMALKRDGTVWAWGDNTGGQLGDGSTAQRKTPVQVIGLTKITAIAAGANHSLALKDDGTIWAWGNNANGQLGDGTQSARNTAVQVNGLTGMVAIAAGENHSLALKDDGTVWAWGLNTNGQLGDDTQVMRKTAVQVSGLTGVTMVECGANHSMALRSDGTVWAWGLNTSGQLGDGTLDDKHTTGQVSGLSSIKSIAAGANHSIALKSDGTVWTWGGNDKGQLGNGNTTDSNTPVQAKESVGNTALSDAVTASAGTKHTIVLRVDGAVWTGGSNDKGQLGDNSTADRYPLVQAAGINLLKVLVVAVPTASDTGNETRREISVGFIAAGDEENITGYRVFVVPSEQADAFTLSIASGLDSAKYKAEVKNGINTAHTVVVTPAIKDTAGADIINEKIYKVFVMSVGKNGYISSLSSASGPLSLYAIMEFNHSSYSVDEDESSVEITVTRTGNTLAAVRVDYATSNGTALAGTHYTSANGTLIFASGEISKTFNVSITNNDVYGGNKVVNLTLSNPTGTSKLGDTKSATLTIIEDELDIIAKIQFSSGAYSVSENGETASITVTRTDSISGTAMVDYATGNGTGTSGIHYTAVSGTLIFAEGEDSKTFTVTITDNKVFGGDKTVNLTLSNTEGRAELGETDTAVLTIIDDEAYATADAAVEGSGGSIIVVDGGISYTDSNSVQLHFTGLTNVKKVRVSLDGINWSPYEEVAQDEFSKQINFINGSDGEKAVFYQFQNSAGTESQILSKKLMIDTTAPAVALQTTDGSMIAKNGVFKFRVNITEKTSKKIIYSISVNDETVVSDTTTTSRNFNVELSDLPLNQYSLISISIRDIVGNQAEKNVSVLAK